MNSTETAALGRADGNCVVIDTRKSPCCRLRPVPIEAVCVDDRFWRPRLDRNRKVTLPSQYRHCEDTGRIDNFRRASGKKQGEFQGIFFNDSDVYKWIEAASFAIADTPDPALQSMIDVAVREVADAQGEDGYLNTYFTFERKGERFTNLRDLHEMYCAGHLLQAAVAHHRATGDRTLLDVGIRLAGHICRLFGPNGRPEVDGHEEIEMALVELFRETGDERYLRQADFFVSQRGRKPPVIGGSPYHQDHLPFREQREVTGHAVRMLYLCCGAADLYAETGENALLSALTALWTNFHGKRQYVQGGAGSRYEGEAFGADFELPNDRAYAESCAAIASAMWNWRMLQLDGDPIYADDMEIALYNGILSGISLDGGTYFYQNPLADRGSHRRQPWFGCACCPPNIARTLASLPGILYGVSDEGAWVHLYARGGARLALPSGGEIEIRVETDYPWDGEVKIRVETAPAMETTLFLRVPAWCSEALVEVNDAAPIDLEAIKPGSYLPLRRTWKAGDRVRLTLPMPVVLLESHPFLSNTGRAAIRRGPLLYCIEGVDHPGVDPWAIRLPHDVHWTAEDRPDLLDGVVTLRAMGKIVDIGDWEGQLYREWQTNPTDASVPVDVIAVPYYAWANREPGAMQVWIPLEL